MRKFDDKPWYPLTVAISIGVIVYVVLTHTGAILKGIGRFIGFFSPVILGAIIAYIVNPLAKFYEKRLYRVHKAGKNRHGLSNILAFITFILFLALMLFLLIPQLVASIMFLTDNLDSYLAAAKQLIDDLGITGSLGGLEEFLDSSGNLLKKLLDLLTNNIDRIISGTASAGKGLVNGLIAFILSIYIISDKDRIKGGLKRLAKALIPAGRYDKFSDFIRKCDVILEQYVTHNFIDSLIVGIANGIFMAAFGLPYVGLVSAVVALTNLIPTFGPIIGWFIGAFLLVLIKPWYALAFTLFTVLMQSADGYVIKPKLFGDTLGVSGLLILSGIIVGGRMFGIIGILLAIPGVAIIDLFYREVLILRLEAARKEKDGGESSPPPDEK